MADIDLKSFAPDTEDRAALRRSFFGSVVGQAAVLVGLLIFYFGGLAILVGFAGEPLKDLRRWFEDDFGRAWGLGLFYLILAGPFLTVIAFNALPFALRARSEARLKRLAFETVPTPPVSVFRLAPYSAIDRERYRRLDGLHTRALDWLRTPPDTVLHLAGESGVGKSSLLAAFLVPALTDDRCAVPSSGPSEMGRTVSRASCAKSGHLPPRRWPCSGPVIRGRATARQRCGRCRH